MKILLIASVLGFLTLASCSNNDPPVVSYQPVQVPDLVLPRVTPISTRPVTWVVVNSENVTSVLSSMPEPQVLMAISVSDYEDMARNLNDIRSFVEEQQAVATAYRRYIQQVNATLETAVSRQ